ncbi:hypothetical protein QNI19_24250 [Cytophagaceae bacterium DM2B3-1]|uniref:Uncharacterized protein n=1 Tax=Xanthocytophaga flava TaxID=3048013 RepID=A0ABT7CSV8_9BACT|nr:hypothetical protein [Xanthocytophaga flavus]MDJ1496070.1 hypothetical protein [Xanthocytophaga flavus]
MCKNTSQLKFCTCIDTPEGTPDPKDTYVWVLSRLVGLKKEHLIGRVMGPTQDLGNGITAETIAQLLNDGNCFDFDYTPSKDDTLSISIRSGSYQYFTLIFRGQQWEEGNNPSFISIKEQIAKGTLEIIQ